MKFHILLLFAAIACRSGSDSTEQAKSEPADSTLQTAVTDKEPARDYSPLYGHYLHENNTTGFTAVLELKPQGNDFLFTLSLLHSTCEASLDGTIGMVYHGQDAYAGFFDSEACRLAFNFFLTENTIRVDEIGICRVHPTGCSFGGTYVKRKPAD